MVAFVDWRVSTLAKTEITAAAGTEIFRVVQGDNTYQIDLDVIKLYVNSGIASFPVSDIDSAATCNIGGATTPVVRVVGSVAITSFGTATNTRKYVYFAGSLTLTHNATSLILPGGRNIVTQAGDCAVMISDASGNWRCFSYTPAGDRFIFAESFGAKGDGTTDDGAALQAALTYAGLVAGTVYLLGKTYLCAADLTLPDGASFYGVPGSKVKASGTRAILLQCGPASGTSQHTVNVGGILFNGNSTCSTAVVNCRNLTFSEIDVVVTNGSAAGLLTGTDTSTVNTKALRNYYRVRASSNTGIGMKFVGEKDTRFGVLLANNNGSHGVVFQAFNNATLAETTECQVVAVLSRDNGGDGCVLDGAEKFTINSVNADINAGYGLRFLSTYDSATSTGTGNCSLGQVILRKNGAGQIRVADGAIVYDLAISDLKLIDYNTTANLYGGFFAGVQRLSIGSVTVVGATGTALYFGPGTVQGSTRQCSRLSIASVRLSANGIAASNPTHGLYVDGSTSIVRIGKLDSANSQTTGTNYELNVSSSVTDFTIGSATITSSSGSNGINGGSAVTFEHLNLEGAVSGFRYDPTLSTAYIGAGGANRLTLTTSAFSPSTSGSVSLGTSSLRWNGAHFQSSTALNWNNGTYTVTQSSTALAFSGTATFGTTGTTLGTIGLLGNTSGTVTIRPQAAAGTPTLTLPNASGTFAVSATSPLAVNSTTGDITITGSALTRTNDTNVTLTLGGTPASALLAATSLTLGWTGTLAAARLNSNVVQAITNDTNVTGSISTQTLTLGWTGQLGLTRGGTNASLTASNGGIVYSTATAMAILAGTATAGQMLQSGASAAPTWSTATFPATAGSAGNVLRSNGTNFLSTTLAASDLSNGVQGTGAVILASGPTFTGGITTNGGCTFNVPSNNIFAFNFNIQVTGGQVGFGFSDNGSSKWAFYKNTDNSLNLYDNTNGANFFSIYQGSLAAGQMAFGLTNDATSSTSGSVVFAGGVGVNKRLFTTDLTVTNTPRINVAASSIGTGAKTISNAADSSTNFGKYFTLNLNGTTVYVPCSTVAPT